MSVGISLLIFLAIAPARVGTSLDGWVPPIDQCVVQPSVYHSCEGISNSFQCADLLEACLMISDATFVRRDREVLYLLLRTGEWITFKDRVPTAVKGTPFYSVVEHDRTTGFYVIQAQHYESVGYEIPGLQTTIEEHLLVEAFKNSGMSEEEALNFARGICVGKGVSLVGLDSELLKELRRLGVQVNEL